MNHTPAELTAPASLLHLDSSASPTEHSVSRQLTALFANTWRERHDTAGYRYQYRDLAAEPVPLVGPGYVTLGQRLAAHGVLPPAQVAAQVQDPSEEQEWALTLPLIQEVLAADTLLLGVPMYNFAVPAALKAWIDRITFPGAFTDPRTEQSLLRGTRVVIVTARGGGYGPGTPREAFDHQTSFLRMYFGNLGVAEEDLFVIHAELTRAGAVPALAQFKELAASSLATAREQLLTLATADPRQSEPTERQAAASLS
ncbi:FMN-dependent NADH-azoreductase [Kitasatospora kifunensis]|uniref:FMN dependent NADH:quinone oxidoreductase n=1 Tax=Kitasatospora kifunensis TaxID=58351 RepID=A0A7W7QWX8_KITKI|nr:NAD(P)H-dependent oxidoreductase [Kitasatospora kifunensis]MBB4921321.1 FMN-dependent NADH-azoreductase [Kitasatospora kifunensis]